LTLLLFEFTDQRSSLITHVAEPVISVDLGEVNPGALDVVPLVTLVTGDHLRECVPLRAALFLLSSLFDLFITHGDIVSLMTFGTELIYRRLGSFGTFPGNSLSGTLSFHLN
jgi:hypothetical protein